MAVTLNGYTYRSSVATVNGEPMIGVSDAVRQASGVAGGDTVEVDVVLDTAPRTITVPDDLAAALDAEPEARATFDKLVRTATSGSGSVPDRRREDPRHAPAPDREGRGDPARGPAALSVSPSPTPSASRRGRAISGSRSTPSWASSSVSRLRPVVAGRTRSPGLTHSSSARSAWIQRHLDRRAQERAEVAARGGLADGARLRFRGDLHRLRLSAATTGRSSVSRIVTADDSSCASRW